MVKMENQEMCKVFTGGPGSGKTAFCRKHVASLVGEGYRVLVVSFTKAAALQLAVEGAEARTIDSFYYRRLKEAGALSAFTGRNFGLLGRRFTELMKDPGYVDEIQSRYDIVVLDEGQDSNKSQLRNLYYVSDGRLHVFGDIDQCIYEWRNAQPNTLLDFCENHGVVPVSLPRTYRLTKQVLKASQNVIVHNCKRFSSPMVTDKEGPEPVVEKTLYDVEAAMARLKEINSDDVAVLVRNVRGRNWLKDFWAQGLCKEARSHRPFAGTLHGSKGLEWDNVIMVRADVWEFEREPIEEARRLFYTGMTRAANSLYISAFEPVCFVGEMDGN